MMITYENQNSLASIKSKLYIKMVKMYTYRKLQKYCTHTQSHTLQKAHSYTHYMVSWKILELRFSQIQNWTACSQCTGREVGGRWIFVSFKSIQTFPSCKIQIMWDFWVPSDGALTPWFSWYWQHENIAELFQRQRLYTAVTDEWIWSIGGVILIWENSV